MEIIIEFELEGFTFRSFYKEPSWICILSIATYVFNHDCLLILRQL